SSIGARLGHLPNLVAYAASKGAIDTFTVGLAKEVGPLGIRVNAVRPGLIDTEIHAGSRKRFEEVAGTVPLGARAAAAEEVAAAVLWLVSDEASYITGAVLDVTGGR
ncbi:MAG: SDR family oxidoreductase, partial [Alphaproteobacteria bacterium]